MRGAAQHARKGVCSARRKRDERTRGSGDRTGLKRIEESPDNDHE
jgi:hypothetical protein